MVVREKVFRTNWEGWNSPAMGKTTSITGGILGVTVALLVGMFLGVGWFVVPVLAGLGGFLGSVAAATVAALVDERRD